MKVKKILTSKLLKKRRKKEHFQRFWLMFSTNRLRKKLQKQYLKTGAAVLKINVNDFRYDIEQRLKLLEDCGEISFEVSKTSQTGKAKEFTVNLIDLLPIVQIPREEASKQNKKVKKQPNENLKETQPLDSQLELDLETEEQEENKVVLQF